MKRWIAVLLVLACCFMLASCSNRDTGTAAGSDAAASAGGDTAGQTQDGISLTGEGKMLYAFAVRGVFNLALVPWGDTESWDTVSDSYIGTYPAMYNDWYLPKVQNGESMPDSFS